MDLLKRPLIVAVDGVKPESILRFDDRSIFTGVPCTYSKIFQVRVSAS